MLLIFVFDGLRPELVRPDLMPRLCALRNAGTWFDHSHCVFPPVTRVNAASLATGSLPGTHGISGNTLYLPDAAGALPFGTTASVDVLRSLRTGPNAPLLTVPTLAAVLGAAGRRTAVVGTGSPGSAYLLSPEASRHRGVVFHYCFSEPPGLLARVTRRLGPHAGREITDDPETLIARVEYAARALTDAIVPEVRPDLLYFWSTIPDALHHRYGLGSFEALQGLTAVDGIFGDLVDRLGWWFGGALDVIVTSDHGYATVSGIVDVGARLREQGFPVGGGAAPASLTVDGSAAHLFLNRASGTYDAALRGSLAAFLLKDPGIAAVFTADGSGGSFRHEDAGVACARAAAVIVCLPWQHGDNGRGVAGLSLGGGRIPVGGGDHGGCSPFELRNALIACGPSFKRGTSRLPAGIIDIAPTVCHLLGLQPPAAWDGRVLFEAHVADRDGETPAPVTNEIRKVGAGGRTLLSDRTGHARYLHAAGYIA